MEYPNSSEINFGRITSADYGDSIVKFDYTYVENENNIATKTFDHRSDDPYNEYAYTDIDRLAQADYLKGELTENEVFTMDDLGNRKEVDLRDGADEVYDVNDVKNQYMAVDDSPLEYDAAGNLTEDKDGYQYTYDYENRIIEIKDSSNNDIAEFAYDALGRRIKKYDAIADETTLYYYNENWQVLAEYDGGGNFKKMNVFGNYIDELLYRRSSAGITRRFYVHDHLYSPVVSIRALGTVSERYEYDAYGNCTIWDSAWTERTQPTDTVAYPNPYLFTGRRIDYLDSGDLPLMYYRNRYYDTYTGRFGQHDPWGYVDGMNLYEYAKINPLSFTDPYGLKPKPVEPPGPTPTTKYPWGDEFDLASCMLYCDARYFLGKLTPGWEDVIEEILSKWWKKFFKWLCTAQSVADLTTCRSNCNRWDDQINDTFDDPVLEPGGDPWPK